MKTTLEVNGNNGPGIKFEQIALGTIPDSEDEMHGDQLFGHPIMKEIEALRGHDRKVYTVEVKNKSKKDIKKTIKDLLSKLRK